MEACEQTRFDALYAQHLAWPWVDMLKAPVVKALPDVLTLEEIARLVLATRERRHQTFCLPWQTNQQIRGGRLTAWAQRWVRH